MDMEMKVIPNGIDTSEFRPDYNYGGEKLEILCVSRLTPRKRVSDVIKAVEDLEGVKLTVIGEGQREKKLKGLLKIWKLKIKLVLQVMSLMKNCLINIKKPMYS